MVTLNNKQQFNLLDLYAEEIISRIGQNLISKPSELRPLDQFLHKEQWEALLHVPVSATENDDENDVMEFKGDPTEKQALPKTADNGNGNNQQQEEEDEEKKAAATRARNMKIGTEIWCQLKESAMRAQLYHAVMEFLKRVDTELHELVCVEGYVDKEGMFVNGFTKLLLHSPELIALIAGDSDEKMEGADSIQAQERWEKFSHCLCGLVVGFGTLVNPLVQRVRDGKLTIARAMKLLLRSLPTSNINGYEHVLHAIANCGDEQARQFVERIYPDFNREYEYINSYAIKRHHFFYVVRPDDDLSAAIEMGMKNEVPPPGANVLNIWLGIVPPLHIRACNIDICIENPINLRPYQTELTTEALEGRNVIICAPTGSGKTIVGAYIIRQHLLTAIHRNQRAKACFIVPTNALVVQQKRLFQKHIGHFAKVCGPSSENLSLTNPIKSVMESADIVVITPQLLINELERRPTEIDEEAFKPFRLDMFTLIIFDESHHSKDDHPYNVLMANYHQMKMIGRSKHLPQIIGMTASLGIGGSATKNLDDAVRYILEICANMDAQWISCVRREKANLILYMPSVVEHIRFVEQHNDCEFLNALFKQIEWLKALMNAVPEAKANKEIKTTLTELQFMDPTSQPFENWLATFKHGFLKAISADFLSNTSRERLTFCVDQLLLLYYSINFLKLFGPPTMFRYIQKMEDESLKLKAASELANKIRQWMNGLQTIVTHGMEKNQHKGNSPLLQKLIKILNDQFVENPNSRVLIFLKQRDQCDLLSTLLNEQTQHPSDFFTGQASRDEGGQNIRLQKAKLEEFSRGAIKVLCATTIAEEGIDISACNLIVHYNYVTNEIARVQRRGRGRASNAQTILLTCEQTIRDKEEQNALREKMMHDALDELARWPRALFQQKVAYLVNELNRKRKEKAALESARIEERRREGAVFDIVCSSCSRFLCSSTKMAFMGSHYIIADKEFWCRTHECRPLPPEKANSRECKGSTPHVGEHTCLCNQKLGRIIQCRGGILLPNLSCERITFIRRGDGGMEERVPVRKWAKVAKELFLVEKITSLQLVEMKNAPHCPTTLLQADVEDDSQMQ